MARARRDAGVDACIEKLAPNLQEIAAGPRHLVFEADPDIEESLKWSRPPYSRNGLVCHLDKAGGHVSLGFFRGYGREAQAHQGPQARGHQERRAQGADTAGRETQHRPARACLAGSP